MVLNVIETIGNCSRCGEKGILGDGLCQECWDIEIGRSESTLGEIQNEKGRSCQTCSAPLPPDSKKTRKFCETCTLERQRAKGRQRYLRMRDFET